MSKPNSVQAKLAEAMALIGYFLWDLDEDRKKRYCLGSRKGKVFQVRDEDGKVLCTYSSLAQIKKFLLKKIGE